ncbi:MAG: LacI family transcriptional regulator [Sterolibacterium sp.]|nr:LacI family transcriptional regulator [Sterolibacterium sp.]
MNTLNPTAGTSAVTETPRWRELLEQAIEDGETKQDIANRLLVSRTMVSLALADKYPSRIDAFAKRVIDAYDGFTCPHLCNRVTALDCKEYALRAAPTSSARDARHWRACQACNLMPQNVRKPVQEARQ